MLTNFREAIKEGTYKGAAIMRIAEGLMFLDNLVAQSEGQIQMAKRQEKEGTNGAA